MGWILKYLVGSLSGNLFEISGVEGYADTFNQTAASFGNIGWHLTALAITFAIMVYGIASGIEKANKVMMPLFFVMFVGMAVYIATLPGASQGYRYLTDPDWSLLASGKTWIYALGQAFFSLSLAGSGTLVYGSYLKRDVDIPYSARTVALWDTIAALAAAVTIIPAMATAGQSLSGGGPGLMFIYPVSYTHLDVYKRQIYDHPASVDSIPSSANQEDHVSMGTTSARTAAMVLDNAQKVLGIEIAAAAQAIWLRQEMGEGGIDKLAQATKAAYDHIRSVVDPIDKDVIMHDHLTKFDEMIKDGSLLEAVEKTVTIK